MKAEQLAERDGWICWLCGAAVDPDAPLDAPHRGTVDHVVPRSRGGATVPENLRLAHRRCNGRRADTLPELRWPTDLAALDTGDLWTTIARLVRRPGSVEIAGLFPTPERARAASTWAVDTACGFVGGEWRGWAEPTGVGDTHVVRLTVSGAADPGRPKVADGSDARVRGRGRRSSRSRRR